MKKIISLVLIMVVCCLCFCGCSVSSATCEIKKESGETENISSSELLKKIMNNDMKCDEYEYCSISGTGKITKIENGAGYEFSYTVGESYHVVTLNDNVNILINDDYIIDCDIGDTVSFSGTIQPFLYKTDIPVFGTIKLQ